MRSCVQRLATSSLLVLFLVSGPSFAAFQIKRKTTTAPNYGQGQAKDFQKALSGGEPISSEEQQDLNRILPSTDQNRYYLKTAVNFGNVGVSHVNNHSSTYTGALSNRKHYVTQRGLNLGFGYRWVNWRAELEGFINRNFDYNTNISNVLNPQIKSTVNNSSLLINLYRDYEGIGFIRPYIVGGLGLGFTSINTKLYLNTSLQEEVTRSHGYAANLGFGLRYRAWKSVDVDLSYRYGILGPARWKMKQQMELLGLNRLNVLTLGVVYFF